MTWTITKEETLTVSLGLEKAEKSGAKIHVRAIIDIDNQQAEIKELIAALGKHVKMEPPSGAS